MGRLAGFSYREIIKILKIFGFVFHRQAVGSHEIWFNSETNGYTTIPNHSGKMPDGIFIPRLYDPFQNHIHRYQQPYSVSLFRAIQ